MGTYHKIQTMFKRDQETKHIIEGDWTLPEFEYLQNNQWVFTEKVDGTNIRVAWDGNDVVYGGRTDNAQIPNGVINRLNDLFYSLTQKEKLREMFPEGCVTFFGEGYGAKIQNGGNYGHNQDFVLFDIQVDGLYLERENIETVAAALGLNVVPIVGVGTLHDAISLVRAGMKSTWGDFTSEGIVARTSTELLTRRGERLITKIKHRDFY